MVSTYQRRISRREIMAVDTVRFSGINSHKTRAPKHVDLVSDRFKMVGVDAPCYPAKMIEIHPVRNYALRYPE
jgi:hypothetical protein